MQVILKQPESGQTRIVKLGFSWLFFLLSWLYGIPLFIKGLYLHGAVIFCICSIVLFARSPATLNALGLVLIGLTIFYGIKGNELVGKRLLAKGWKFADGDSNADYARAKWGIPA